jgi:protein required for attachment to host cells
LAYVQQELLDVSQQLRSLTESMNNSRIDQHSFTSGRVGESGTSNGHQFTNMSMSDLSPNNKRSTDTSRSHVIPSPIRYVESSVMQSPQPFAEKKNQLDENIINAMIKESLKEKLTQLITVAKDQYFQNTPT